MSNYQDYKMGKMTLIAFTLLLIGMLMLIGSVSAQEGNDESDDDEGNILGLAFVCVFMIAMIILSIVIGIWVYRDANSRGMEGALWLIVVLIGGLIGLIIYLIIRRDHPVGGFQYPGYPPGYYQPAGYLPGNYPLYPPPPYQQVQQPPPQYPQAPYQQGPSGPPDRYQSDPYSQALPRYPQHGETEKDWREEE